MTFDTRAAFLAHYLKSEFDVQKDLDPKTKKFTGREYVYDGNMRRHYLEDEIKNQK